MDLSSSRQGGDLLRKFNLLEEPWIPVRRGEQVEEVGLATALLQAPELSGIETPSPLVEAALHRLLLAVLHRAINGPRDLNASLDLLVNGSFPKSDLESYFHKHYDRFFLFHPTAPFWQIADLPESPPPLPWNRLLPEIASGHNPTLFDHTVEDEARLAPLSYGAAARALVVHQTFAPGGLLRRFGVTAAKDAPLARAAVFLPTGPNLFATLVLNLVAPYKPDGDAPIWEVAPLRLKDVEKGATQWPLDGVTRVYTWPTRGIRFLDEGDGVRFMAYGPGITPLEAAFRDPMVAYRRADGEDLEPLRLRVDKSFWRDFAATLPQARGELAATVIHATELSRSARLLHAYPCPMTLRVLGQVTDQAKLLDVRREVYPLPPDFLTSLGKTQLYEAIRQAEELGQQLHQAAQKIAQALLGSGDFREREAFVRSIPLLRRYWAELDRAFLELVGVLGKEEALAFWQRCLRGAALAAWQETRRCLGTQARHLRSLVEGERVVLAAVGRLKGVGS